MISKRSNLAGFTLVEALISLAVLSIVGAALTTVMRSMLAMTESGTARADLQRVGNEALHEILQELKSSGVVEIGGVSYPYVFDDGSAEGDYAAHKHDVPVGAATANDYDFGVTREIVFVLPADADNDGVPDVDANGELVFAPEEISYVLNTGLDGTAQLERRVDTAAPQVLVSDVERVVFDDAGSSGFEVPLDAVRVRIYFRAIDDDGREVRQFVEGTTRLRNG